MNESCLRAGITKDRIKEQQLKLLADRTSAATLRANQLRVYFAAFAHMQMDALRRLGPVGTELARAGDHDPAKAPVDRDTVADHGAQGA
ncbi:MAG: transposase [Gammaproteobacteria bacterium]|jgi:hypothetical protein